MRSSVSEVELVVWRAKWQVPSDVHFYVPAENERPDQLPRSMVAVNYHMMESGLRFPLHPNISHLLAAWGMAPLQIHPNGWVNILSLFSWLGKLRLYRMPTPAEVYFVFTLIE